MEYVIFSFGTSICLVLSILVPLGIIWGLNQVYKSQQMEETQRKSIMKKVTLGMLTWVLLVSGVSLTGFFYNFNLPPRLFLLFIGIFGISFGLTFSKQFTTLLASIPPSWLMHIQFFRVPVEIMLWILFLEGIAPQQMTFEGQNWDILAGITAPVFGYFCFKEGGWGRKVAIWWNIGGLALLANIITVAILSLPTPFRVFMNEPTNTMVAKFPMVLLPAVLVTVALAMHLFSLRQLLVHKNSFKN
ncbi:MAG: hypothetical protein ACPGJS_17360 [Flammeovirgaceae bacterium]